MKTNRSLPLVATGMFAVLSAIPATALTIGFSPSSQTVPLGSNPQVDLIATLGGTPSLGGWDLLLEYDPAIITLNSVVFGTALGFGFQSWDISNILLGQVRLTEVSLQDAAFFTNQLSSFTLATLTFSADMWGTSPLNLAIPLLSTPTTAPAPSWPTTGAAQKITDVVLQNGSITVRQPNQTVPDGGNLAIVALPTLLGLLFLGKRAQHVKP